MREAPEHLSPGLGPFKQILTILNTGNSKGAGGTPFRASRHGGGYHVYILIYYDLLALFQN